MAVKVAYGEISHILVVFLLFFPLRLSGTLFLASFLLY